MDNFDKFQRISVETEDRMHLDKICEYYEDYYEHVASARYIRPIKVSEGVNFSSLSVFKKILWWCKTVINLLG